MNGFLNFLISFPTLLHSGIIFGTVIMYGALGEIITEKSGNLNLGVPGIIDRKSTRLNSSHAT